MPRPRAESARDGAAGPKKGPRSPEELTPRGLRTRAQLVEAARLVFDRDGFSAAKITDIARGAGAAVGSFYTYFGTKEEIFRAVLLLVESELTAPLPREVGLDPLARIEAGNRAYVRGYRKHARILAVMQHRSFEDPELYELRQRSRRRWIDRAERAIRRLQIERRVPADVSARFAATALSGMVHDVCYETFAFGASADVDEDEVATSLARLWARALGILPAPPRPKTRRIRKTR
ncbi:MAG: TetR family transcriptional regulator [Labilithrix sp.]|nr:TetR family transcriptional regulator [Labilithrix sp.]